MINYYFVQEDKIYIELPGDPAVPAFGFVVVIGRVVGKAMVMYQYSSYIIE